MKTVIGLIVVAAVAFLVFQYHFILIDDGLKVLKKSELGLHHPAQARDREGPERHQGQAGRV